MIKKITNQRALKLVMITMALCSFLHAADIALSGTVKDIKGNSLEGVKVALSTMDSLTNTTSADGTFTLSNATSVLLPKDFTSSYGITIRSNAIVFTVGSEKVSGRVALYSVSGRMITSITLDNRPAGQYDLTLTNLSAGTYLLAGHINGKSFTRSLVCMGHNSIRSNSTIRSTQQRGSFGLRKTAAAAVVDTLIASKDGYTTQRWPVNSLSKEKIRMVLRKPGEKPVVYMTKKLGKEGFLAIYEAIGYDLPGEVMVKVHTGEGRPSNKYYVTPERMSSVVNLVNGTIVETCLGFSMSGFTRSTPAANLQLSKEHGFDTIGQGLDIIDTDGGITLPVVGGSQLQSNKIDVGANFKNYQSSLIISHFKGHGIAGFGGAVKNVGIGFATPAAKLAIHNGGKPATSFTMNSGETFQKAMVEAVKAVSDALEGNLVYINAVDNLTLDCDCDPQEPPEMSDIGLLGSLDPVAIDQASCDLVLAADGGDKLKKRIKTDFKGLFGLEYGAEIGLGKTEYELIDIDK